MAGSSQEALKEFAAFITMLIKVYKTAGGDSGGGGATLLPPPPPQLSPIMLSPEDEHISQADALKMMQTSSGRDPYVVAAAAAAAAAEPVMGTGMPSGKKTDELR